LAIALAPVAVPGFCGCQRGCLRRPTSSGGLVFRRAESLDEELEGFEEEEGQEMVEIFKRIQAEVSEDHTKPIFNLTGPFRPPAAPARYKALTKIRLRVAPHSLADLVTPTYTIETGEEFEVVASKEDEKAPGILWLRTSQASGGAWLLERGVAGPFAGRRVAKRIPGSLRGKAKRAPILELSEVATEVAQEAADKAALEPEVLAPLPSNEKKREERSAGVNMAPPSPYERRKPVVELLQDPEIRDLCKEMGVDMETLQSNPAFLEAMARRLYGDEVVS